MAIRTDWTRLTIDWPTAKHRELKSVLAAKGIKMKTFIINAIEKEMKNENEKVEAK